MTWRRSNGTPAGFLGVRAGRAWSSRKSTTLVIAVKLLDEYRQRQLPWLLAVVVKLAELLGVQAKFARHLDLLM